jgi:hypothetical protein
MDDRPGPDFERLPLQPDFSPPVKLSANPLSLPPGVTRALPHGKRSSPGIELRNIVRFLYCHNPFYCISAVLVLWGLVKSFHSPGGLQGAVPRPELLMGGFAGYASLLGAVGWLLIRAGQLWEDIRTILLLIVIIFLACSMSFDEVLTTDPIHGQLYYLGGLAFAVILSESVLHGIRLRLPMFYRVPYYAALALFFLYPLLLGQWLGNENDPELLWRLAGFAPLAGLVTLTLLPAVRRGAGYVRNNGSPWAWPWYPWPLFIVLLVGVTMRSYTLCVSFHPSRGPATIFEPFLLVPLLLAVKAWPLVVLAVLQLIAAVRFRSAVHWLLAASCGIAAACIAWPAEVALRWHSAVPVHLLLLSMLLVGALLNDRVARWQQRVAFAGVVFLSAWVITGRADGWTDIRREVLIMYPGATFLVAVGYGYWVGNRGYRITGLAILAAWSVSLGRHGYGTFRTSVAGLDEILLGMACLLVGLAVSLWKIGIPQAWWKEELAERLGWRFRAAAVPVPPPIDSGGID